MKPMKRPFFFGLLLAWWLVGPARAQVLVHPDTHIQALVDAVSADTIEATVRRLAAFGTRHTLSNTTSETEGIGAARRWIRRTLERYAGGGRMQVAFDAFTYRADGRRIDRDVVLKNVLARLPGADPDDDRVFIVSGHYDSRVSDIMDSTSYAPGAVDDASGTAAVMEMARVLAHEAFPATLLLMTVPGEEQGLLGAEHVAALADSLGWNVAGMITLDIIGNTEGGNGTKDNRTVRLFSEGVSPAETEPEARLRQSVGGENDGKARQLARYIKEVGARYVPHLHVKLVYRRDRFLRGGDHIPFSARGYAAVRMTEPNEAFTRQHQDVRREGGIAYGDVPDAADYAYIADVARVNLAALVNLASAPPPPRNAGLWARGLSVDTRLVWDPPAAGADRVAGYYVLLRDTTAPVWEKKIFVGNVTEYILKGVSKDDYFFGVQSVDAAGHESRIMFTNPAFR